MGWTIFFIVIAVLCLLLLLPVRVQFAVRGKKHWHIKVYYACFRLFEKHSADTAQSDAAVQTEGSDDTIDEEELLFFGSGDAPPVTAEAAEASAPEPKTETTETVSASDAADNGAAEAHAEDISEEKPKKPSILERVKPKSLSEWLDLIHDALASLSPPMRFLFRHLYLRRLYVSMTIASGDAAKTAILYGAISGLVYQLLGKLQCLISVKAEAVRIRADFLNERSTAECSGELRVSPMTALGLAFGIAIPFLWRTWLRLRRQDKLRKQEEKESAPLSAA